MKIRTPIGAPDPAPDEEIRRRTRLSRLAWIADVVSGWRHRRTTGVKREYQLMSVGRTAVDLTNRPPTVFTASPTRLAWAVRRHLEKQGV